MAMPEEDTGEGSLRLKMSAEQAAILSVDEVTSTRPPNSSGQSGRAASTSARVPPPQSSTWAMFKAHAGLVGYLADFFALTLLLIFYLVMEQAGSNRIPFIPEVNLPNMGYPLKPQSVPSWAVPVIAFIFPIVCFCIFKIYYHRPINELVQLIIALLMSGLLVGAITGGLKVWVSKPRPNFIASCWPNGVQMWTDGNSYGAYPVCSSDTVTYMEALRSFPSGHASISAAGLGFFSYFMLGQTRAYTGLGHIWRFMLSIVPVLVSVVIAVTRVCDYWHHPVDVMSGLALGFLIAYAVYRLMYPRFSDLRCDVPLTVQRRATTTIRARASGQGSEFHPLSQEDPAAPFLAQPFSGQQRSQGPFLVQTQPQQQLPSQQLQQQLEGEAGTPNGQVSTSNEATAAAPAAFRASPATSVSLRPGKGPSAAAVGGASAPAQHQQQRQLPV